MKILVLCNKNAARSQMLEAYLKKILPHYIIYSAGSVPALQVDPKAVQVMAEDGIDISNAVPKHISQFNNEKFDYTITVCKEMAEYGACPLFLGRTKHRIDLGIEDPARVKENHKDQLSIYRSARDTIKNFALDFAKKSQNNL
ncbi:MAG: arsenate reductase ArsC [Candidatus Dependentiae bacterium]